MSSYHDDEPVSKSQLKREMHELQSLGEKLANYNEKKLAKFNLTAELLRAIEEAKRIKSHLAKRRQYQYIGRLMRDADLEEIKKVINSIENVGPEVVAQRQLVEQWRTKLMTEGKPALTEFIEQFGHVDVQHLRHLVAAAQKEAQKDLEKHARKELFRYINQIVT